MTISRKDAKKMVGPGWSGILDTLYDAKPRNVVVTTVKEKFGSLHFYVGSAAGEFFDQIEAAEALSEITCEVCGAPGCINANKVGWYSCRCPKCRKEDEQMVTGYFPFMGVK
jgi:hypothetical protein